MTKLPNDQPCSHCGRFANRGLSVDAVIIKGDKVLLIKRGVEPDKGVWGTPGGYVEWDESTEEAVKRETYEETNLKVISARLVGVFSSPTRHPKQVVAVAYRVIVEDEVPQASDDAAAVRWFPLDKLPEKMAFDHRLIITKAVKSNQQFEIV